ncbi:Mms22p Ecym_1440 [Eremothecium cymbalariae DBVPG|uniref:Uncharacterized protein n=1 Tax=Eremothecium cymbalariae (strain CBS 270.75 / DBVPG 7215 / KCTC 17166 / NRRL Y-17582) TaxID=931890 RepID=G8JM95_ERECY|nr:hypothetical protein Ecym_1440 [Eremothecium cymbalariae DBVPG\
MDVDSIPDSLADDGEVVLWRPWADVPGMDSLQIEADDVRRSQAVVEMVPTLGPQRSLRKRKAIQRMPYSLDRLRHRQLLQGYDISNFESLADNLNLPNISPIREGRESITEARTKNYRNVDDRWLLESTQDVGKGTVGFGENGEDDEDQDESILFSRRPYQYRYGRSGFLSQGSELGSESSTSSTEADSDVESSEDMMVFRGKTINVKHGYRGILPKAAWEKSLHNDERRQLMKRSRERTSGTTRRGLAKRKKGRPSNVHDEILLQDIVSDNQADRESSDPDLYQDHEAINKSSTFYELRDYFDDKYSQLYKYDELSDDETKTEVNHIITNDNDVEQRQDERPAIVKSAQDLGSNGRDLNMYMDLIYDSDYETEKEVIEFNDGIIDMMLNTTRKRKPRIQGKKSSNKIMNSKSNKNRLAHRRIPKRSINTRRNISSNHSLATSSGRSLHLTQRNAEQKRSVDDEPESKTNLKKPPNKSGQMVITPDPLAVIYKKPKLFVPVIEGLSDNYILPRQSKKWHRGSNDISAEPTFKASSHLLDSEVFNKILQGGDFQPPGSVIVHIATKTYVVSRLSTHTAEEIKAVFQHIVDIGAVNDEIVTISKQLCDVLCFINKPEIYDVIDEFHRNFRSKVDKLKDRAKPIHFYQISVCQFMLLEITKFNNVSELTKISIEQKIMDHVVSFFKLLSRCFSIFTNTNGLELLIESYQILAIILSHISQLPALWERLQKQKFPPNVCEILVTMFPIKSSYWDIFKPEQTFNGITSWLRFIASCTDTPLSWKIDNRLILQLYEYFKTRKFMDFEEESNIKSYPIFPSGNLHNRSTVFNSFLSLINKATLTPVILERITPIGTLHALYSTSLLVNRLNLLFILGTKVQHSYEKRFEELIEPYFRNGSPSSLKIPQMELLLEAQYSIIEITLKNSIEVRGKSVNLLWKYVRKKSDAKIMKLWESFLGRLRNLFSKFKTTSVLILKNMAPTLHNVLSGEFEYTLVENMLQLYLPNLNILGPEWVQHHLFRVLATPANKNFDILNHYCCVIKYLTETNVITWWSVVNYNLINGDDTIMLHYYTKICEYSDSSFFNQAKDMLYSKVLDFLLKRTDQAFKLYLVALNRRDPRFQIDFNGNPTLSQLQMVKKTIRALHKASYDDLIVKFVSKVRDAYLNDASKRDFFYNTVNFLNNNFVDQIKDTHEFNYMKDEFGISDEEAKKSSYRDYLISLGTDDARCIFIEKELMQMFAHGKDLTNLIVRLKSSLSLSVFDNALKAFVDMISSHPFELGVSVLHMNSTYVLLRILNDYLEENCALVTSNEYYELIRLHLHFSDGPAINFDQNTKSVSRLLLEIEIVKLQCLVVELSYGFAESSDIIRSQQYSASMKSSLECIDYPHVINDGANQYLKAGVKGIFDNLLSTLTLKLPVEISFNGDKEALISRHNEVIDALISDFQNSSEKGPLEN